MDNPRRVILSFTTMAAISIGALLLAGCAAAPTDEDAAAHLSAELDAVEQLVGGEWSASELGSRECGYALTLRGVQSGEYRFTSDPVDGDTKFDQVLASWTDLGFEPREAPVADGNPIRTLEAMTPDGAALTFTASDGSLTLEGLGACASE